MLMSALGELDELAACFEEVDPTAGLEISLVLWDVLLAPGMHIDECAVWDIVAFVTTDHHLHMSRQHVMLGGKC